MKKFSSAFIPNLTNTIKSVLSALLGVNEILFLFGFGMLFRGVQNQFSLDIALIVCGSLLVIVSIGGVIVAQRGAK